MDAGPREFFPLWYLNRPQIETLLLLINFLIFPECDRLHGAQRNVVLYFRQLAFDFAKICPEAVNVPVRMSSSRRLKNISTSLFPHHASPLSPQELMFQAVLFAIVDCDCGRDELKDPLGASIRRSPFFLPTKPKEHLFTWCRLNQRDYSGSASALPERHFSREIPADKRRDVVFRGWPALADEFGKNFAQRTGSGVPVRSNVRGAFKQYGQFCL